MLTVKDISLSYNLPTQNISWLQNGKIYFSVQNAFLFTNYPGYDPDVNTGSVTGNDGQNTGDLGNDRGSYPKARTFTLGVNFNF